MIYVIICVMPVSQGKYKCTKAQIKYVLLTALSLELSMMMSTGSAQQILITE